MLADGSDSSKQQACEGDSREVHHTIGAFDSELDLLRSTVLSMADAAMRNVEGAMRGLEEGDLGRCNTVIAEDEVLDQLEKEIDEIGMRTILRFQPVATDLRRLLSSMSMARMLERIGDHAVNIARAARKILKAGRVDESRMLDPLFTLAVDLLRDATSAFADDNGTLARELGARDKELNRLHKRLTKSLSVMIGERREGAVQLIHLLFVSRSLERIGDLAVNLGEEVVFIESAEDIRHSE